MKFKLKALKRAMDALRYGAPDDAEIEIIVRTEDIQQGKLCDAITMVASWTELPPSYSDEKNPIAVVQTLEMFPESENRPFRVITTKTKEIT